MYAHPLVKKVSSRSIPSLFSLTLGRTRETRMKIGKLSNVSCSFRPPGGRTCIQQLSQCFYSRRLHIESRLEGRRGRCIIFVEGHCLNSFSPKAPYLFNSLPQNLKDHNNTSNDRFKKTFSRNIKPIPEKP